MVFSSSINLPMVFMNSLFLIALEYSSMHMYHILCVYFSVEGHLGCFLLLAFTNKIDISTVNLVSLIYVGSSFDCMPSSVISGLLCRTI